MIPFPSLLRLPHGAASALAALFACLPLFGEEVPDLRVVFGPETTALSGRVDSEATAAALVAAVKSARPDLSPDPSGLAIDPAAALPAFSDLRSLLDEIALSTHEGRLELWPDRLVIGGLTDSLVTQSALRIRIEPILAGRTFNNQLCVVATDDLPKIDVALSHGQMVPADGPAAGPAPAVETPFEAPGVRLDKLLATIHLLGDLDRLAGRAPAVPPSGEPLRAQPVEMTSGTAPPLAPPAADPFEALPSVHFSRNTFLLQANQIPTLDALAQSLLSPSRLGARVRIEALKPKEGSSAFNDYLCERRAAEVARFLTERGVAPSLFTLRTLGTDSPVDSGEVRLLVETLAPPAAPVETATTSGTLPAALPLGDPSPEGAPPLP